ncbi:hypothetical protein [Anaerotignum sp.]|uniref:hypothetical protein n=1 Tax=Anaerotignum sp. TaxID=2039241 RepID=UPI002A9F2D70|nr:hypothetical protein [Anaerotignum sp.]
MENGQKKKFTSNKIGKFFLLKKESEEKPFRKFPLVSLLHLVQRQETRKRKFT